MGHVLAFDYGLRHIGICVGQFVTKTASPLTTLRANDGVPDWSQVAKVVSEWQPKMLLIGLPLNETMMLLIGEGYPVYRNWTEPA